jgi:hypothetical protein
MVYAGMQTLKGLARCRIRGRSASSCRWQASTKFGVDRRSHIDAQEVKAPTMHGLKLREE